MSRRDSRCQALWYLSRKDFPQIETEQCSPMHSAYFTSLGQMKNIVV